MSKLSADDYATVAKAFVKKGIKSKKKIYKLLEEAGFEVTVKGKLYSGLYASRVIAIVMASKNKGTGKPLEL